MNETPARSEAEKVTMIERFGFDQPPVACMTVAGTDQCIYELGHIGQHATFWGGGVLMTWDGDEPWSNDFSSLVAS